MLAVLTGAAAGCATGGQGSPPVEPPGSAVILPFGVQEIVIALHDFRFDPVDLTVVAGSRLVMTARNEADRVHNVTILSPAGARLVSVDIPPRATQRIDVTPEQSGAYSMYCDQLGHRALGMQGIIRVRPRP